MMILAGVSLDNDKKVAPLTSRAESTAHHYIEYYLDRHLNTHTITIVTISRSRFCHMSHWSA